MHDIELVSLGAKPKQDDGSKEPTPFASPANASSSPMASGWGVSHVVQISLRGRETSRSGGAVEEPFQEAFVAWAKGDYASAFQPRGEWPRRWNIGAAA